MDAEPRGAPARQAVLRRLFGSACSSIIAGGYDFLTRRTSGSKSKSFRTGSCATGGSPGGGSLARRRRVGGFNARASVSRWQWDRCIGQSLANEGALGGGRRPTRGQHKPVRLRRQGGISPGARQRSKRGRGSERWRSLALRVLVARRLPATGGRRGAEVTTLAPLAGARGSFSPRWRLGLGSQNSSGTEPGRYP